MTALPRPTLATLFSRFKSMFSATVLGGANIIPESNEWYVVSNDTAIADMFYSIADQQWKERDPRFACCDNLIEMAAMDGFYPNPAKFSEGYVQLTGTGGATMPASVNIAFGDQTYNVVSTIPSTFPTAGTLVFRVKSNQPGTASNLTTTTTSNGTLIEPITGVNTTVTIFGSGFCGGTEAETCEQFRTRYVARLKYKPLAQLAWIESKILEWPCVTRVCRREGNCCTPKDECDTCRDCAECGTKLEFYPMMDNTFTCGVVPQCVADEISVWLFGTNQGYGEGEVPFGVCGSLHTANTVTVNVSIEGMNCLSDEELEAVRTALTDFFKTVCPSKLLCKREIDLSVAQIIADACSYEIFLNPTTTTGFIETDCGDLDMDCDYIPCLGTVTFLGDRIQGIGDCT